MDSNVLVAGEAETVNGLLRGMKSTGLTGSMRAEGISGAERMAERFSKDPPEILIVYPEQLGNKALRTLNILSRAQTAVIAVIPEGRTDLLKKMISCPVRWYLPEPLRMNELREVMRRAAKEMEDNKRVLKIKTWDMQKLESISKREILVAFERGKELREYERFRNAYCRGKMTFPVLRLTEKYWVILCLVDTERMIRRHITCVLRYFGSGENVRCVIGEPSQNIAVKAEMIREMEQLLEDPDLAEGKRMLSLREYRIAKKGKRHKAVAKAICHIEKNYRHRIVISRIAEEEYMAPGYLSSLFAREMGTTIQEYIRLFRVRKAMEMLRDTDLPVSEIAQETGFRSGNYFSRIFKNYTGKTPLSYRNQARKTSGKTSEIDLMP